MDEKTYFKNLYYDKKGHLMKAIEKLNRVNKNVWFVFIFAFSAFLYLYNITFSNLWIDEAFTQALVKHSFGAITGLIQNDFHPPLYFYALKIFVSIFGISVFTIRFFSTLGVLATILLGYVAGQRVFGKSGALYFCLLIVSLPMLASYSHEARMYTWGAFAVTGVFLYSVLFLASNMRKDLILLMLFTLIAAYTHYYALMAAFWANVFVSVYLFVKKNNNFRTHLLYSLIAVLLYIPWIAVMLGQTKKVMHSFWVPALSWQTISSCLLSPFAPKIWLTPFLPLAIVIYGLLLLAVYRIYVARKDGHSTELGLSLFIFALTFLSAVLISVFMRPILYMRYISNIIVLILIPPTLFFIFTKNRWVKGIILAAVFVSGIAVSVQGSFFSFGPYQHSLVYLHEKHPGVKKVFHVLETTAGPFAEYACYGIKNYWYDPESTVVYTNMDVFDNMKSTDSLGKVLKKDEQYCLANFPYMPFNENNVKRILSESKLLEVDTVYDTKAQTGGFILLYMLRYRGTD